MRVKKVRRLPRYPENKIRVGVSPYHDLIQLWILRILVVLDGLKAADFTQESINDGKILRALDLDISEAKDMRANELNKILQRNLREAETKEIHLNGGLERNLSFLEKEIGLNKTERELLTFALILKTNTSLDAACDYLGDLTSDGTINALGAILDIDIDDVRDALSRISRLHRSGILRLERGCEQDMRSMLELVHGYQVLLEPHSNAEELLKSFFFPAGKGSLKKEDFPHIDKEFRVAAKYLKQITKNRVSGVNILLYGPPGTGKTELAKTLSQQIGAKLYEVATVDIENEPLSECKRLEAFRLAQQVLKDRIKTLLLFDEVESLLEGGENLYRLFGGFLETPPTKAYTNKLIEDNHVPSIWIANNIDSVDKAYIRRFDFILRLDHPPHGVRTKIIRKHLASLQVSKCWIDALAKNKNVSPAVIARASKVISSLNLRNEEKVESNLGLILNNSLSAMGYRKIVKEKKGDSLPYCLDIINSDMDLSLLLKSLKKRPEARICLYGPPGTGKTEFGHHIAQTLDKQLLIRRASDILNKYVGGTEENISSMFAEAKQEEAILLLDEADSFLRDRGLANHSWEITQVNELLTQMEAYDGIFICSTNLIDVLDKASARRFDLKVKFDFLKPEQALALFQNLLKILDLPVLKGSSKLRSELLQYSNLTPGDFATVLRQARLGAIHITPDDMLTQLGKESDFKKEPKRDLKIGFTA